jgi:hypothetical protein
MLRFLIPICLRTLMALMAVTLVSGCADSKELTRSRAAALINGAKDFKEPVAIRLRDNYGEVSIPAQSEDEEESVAQPRAIEAFLDNHPALAVLKHLGLIEVLMQVRQKPEIIKAPEIRVEKPSGTTARTPIGHDALKPWSFLIHVSLTDSGKKVAEGNGETIQLYTRRLVEVTGIIATHNGGAQAEFTWRAAPTAVGKVFDPTSDEYKKLPTNLQQGLKKPTGLLQRTPLSDTSEINTSVRKGVAYFQRYDDGWRLISIL